MKLENIFDIFFILCFAMLSIVCVLIAIETFIRIIKLIYPIVNIRWGV